MTLLLSGCAGESNAPVPGAGASSAPAVVALATACSDVECAALAGVCQRGWCDARTGACSIMAAREGEPCLEGNPCGASQCRSGECVPLAPPACAELSDACSSGVCRPPTGCVAEPRLVPGAHEATAVPLPSQGLGQATAWSSCPAQRSVPIGCAEGLTGPSSIFELDLREATELTRAQLIVDARFAFEAALTRGPSADPAVLHCAEPFYTLGNSRRIDAELEPGHYHLVVTGRSEGDRGAISVASTLGTPDPVPLANDDCATPLVLDLAIEQQTIIPSTLGATPQTTSRCAPIGSPDVFYELDLSRYTSDVMLDVDVEGLDGVERGSTSLFAMGSDTCAEILACERWWSRRVSPGIYKLALHFEPEDVSEGMGVRVGVSTDSCPSPINDRPETALELDPALAKQRIRGNTACGNDDVSTACSEDRGAPDLFYRLDLRNQTAPTRLELEGEYAPGLLTYVLVSSDDAEALRPTQCQEPYLDFVLAPRLYYLVIDGRAQNAGRFDLELGLRYGYTDPPDCEQDLSTFGFCLSDSEPACAISPAHPACIGTAIGCGLAPDVYATFCTAYPGCCDGAAPTASCEGPWEAVSFCAR